MKLVGIAGAEGGRGTTVGVVVTTDDVERVTPLARVEDFYDDVARWRAAAAAVAEGDTPLAEARLAPMVPPSARVLCLGLNYRAHADEGVYGVPDHPKILGRWTRSLSVGDVPVAVPDNEPGLDWEGEVAAVVGERLHAVDAATAERAVLGYAAFNDLTARRPRGTVAAAIDLGVGQPIEDQGRQKVLLGVAIVLVAISVAAIVPIRSVR